MVTQEPDKYLSNKKYISLYKSNRENLDERVHLTEIYFKQRHIELTDFTIREFNMFEKLAAKLVNEVQAEVIKHSRDISFDKEDIVTFVYELIQGAGVKHRKAMPQGLTDDLFRKLFKEAETMDERMRIMDKYIDWHLPKLSKYVKWKCKMPDIGDAILAVQEARSSLLIIVTSPKFKLDTDIVSYIYGSVKNAGIKVIAKYGSDRRGGQNAISDFEFECSNQNVDEFKEKDVLESCLFLQKIDKTYKIKLYDPKLIKAYSCLKWFLKTENNEHEFIKRSSYKNIIAILEAFDELLGKYDTTIEYVDTRKTQTHSYFKSLEEFAITKPRDKYEKTLDDEQSSNLEKNNKEQIIDQIYKASGILRRKKGKRTQDELDRLYEGSYKTIDDEDRRLYDIICGGKIHFKKYFSIYHLNEYAQFSHEEIGLLFDISNGLSRRYKNIAHEHLINHEIQLIINSLRHTRQKEEDTRKISDYDREIMFATLFQLIKEKNNALIDLEEHSKSKGSLCIYYLKDIMKYKDEIIKRIFDLSENDITAYYKEGLTILNERQQILSKSVLKFNLSIYEN